MNEITSALVLLTALARFACETVRLIQTLRRADTKEGR